MSRNPTRVRKFLVVIRFPELGINRIACVRARSLGHVEAVVQRHVAKSFKAGVTSEITELQHYLEINEEITDSPTSPSTSGGMP